MKQFGKTSHIYTTVSARPSQVLYMHRQVLAIWIYTCIGKTIS